MPLPPRPVLLVSAATAASLLGDQVLYSVLPVYYASLGLAPIQVGILLSANRWVRLATNHLAHVLTERIASHRTVFVGAFALGVLTTAAYTVTGSFAVLLGARVAWGLAWSFIRHLGVLHIMSETPATSAGRTMGYYNGISRLGSVLGLFGGALLVDLLGFAPALWLLAGASAVSVPLAGASMAGAHRFAAPLPEARGSARGPRTFWVLAWIMGAVGPGFVMSTLGAAFSARVEPGTWGVSAATLTGALLALRFGLDGLAAPWLGGLTDRFGVRFAAAGFYAVGGVALLLGSRSGAALTIAAFVLVFFVCGTALQAGISGTASRFGSAYFSRYVTAADFGSACGPLFGWLALDWLGQETAGLLIGGALYVTASVAVALAPRLRAR
jgi:predicted MFS family arabinose efflux permease